MENQNKRDLEIVKKILPYLTTKDRILDIGSGSCRVCYYLQQKGFSITALDIKNKSQVSSISPIIYDGKKLPFSDNSFDVSLLITVLHHTQDPVTVLKEAKRVSKRIIVMEDLYEGIFQKYATFLMDSIYNLEFFNHPHNNMTEAQWKKIFTEFDLHLINEQKNDWWIFFTSGIFYLEK